jgi:Pvc16 N-terminal domain
MIHDVDASLSELLSSEALNGTEAEIVFDAPTKDWAARRNTPTVDAFLYDIREDVSRRDRMLQHVRDPLTGQVTSREPPPRRFRLSYLLTVWTRRPEDEHRLLAQLLTTLVRYDRIPARHLQGELAEQPLPVILHLALPPSQDRSLTDIWSALGGELKPSIDLVAIAPLATGRALPAGPPVQERHLDLVRRDLPARDPDRVTRGDGNGSEP